MYSSAIAFTLALDGGGCSTLHPGQFTPRKDLAPIVWKAGWVTGLVWIGAKNLAPTGVRSPNRPGGVTCTEIINLYHPGLVSESNYPVLMVCTVSKSNVVL